MINFTDRFISFILFLHISYSYDSKVTLPLLLEKSCFKTLYMKNLLSEPIQRSHYDLSVDFFSYYQNKWIDIKCLSIQIFSVYLLSKMCMKAKGF